MFNYVCANVCQQETGLQLFPALRVTVYWVWLFQKITEQLVGKIVFASSDQKWLNSWPKLDHYKRITKQKKEEKLTFCFSPPFSIYKNYINKYFITHDVILHL